MQALSAVSGNGAQLRRALLATLLVVALVGLTVHFEDSREARWPYPSGEDVASNPSAFVGQKVLLFGTYKGSQNGESRVGIGYSAGQRVFSVTGATFPDDAEVVQVYGTIGPASSIAAENTVVVTRQSVGRTFKLGVSVIGALLVLGVFFRQWGVDWRSLQFVRRSDG